MPLSIRSSDGIGEAFDSAVALRDFMLRQTRDADLQLFYEVSGRERPSAREVMPMSVVLPAGATTGPGTFRVVNRPSYRVSNAVSLVIGAVPTIASVTAAGGIWVSSVTRLRPLRLAW